MWIFSCLYFFVICPSMSYNASTLWSSASARRFAWHRGDSFSLLAASSNECCPAEVVSQLCMESLCCWCGSFGDESWKIHSLIGWKHRKLEEALDLAFKVFINHNHDQPWSATDQLMTSCWSHSHWLAHSGKPSGSQRSAIRQWWPQRWLAQAVGSADQALQNYGNELLIDLGKGRPTGMGKGGRMNSCRSRCVFIVWELLEFSGDHRQ